MSGALAGVRVLDLTMNVMGPCAGQLLGEMGADVWKVEPPEGDTLRGIGPSRSPKMGPYFLGLNRNKRSLALDLKHPLAAPVARRLLAHSDVLISTHRPKSLDRLGLSYEAVREINPRIVYCNVFGYGQDGPYADKPAYDDLIQGAIGLASIQGGSGEEPRYVALAMVDRVVGITAAGMIGMALYYRAQTGLGQKIEIPMFETMAQFVFGDHQYGMFFEPPMGDAGYPRMLDPNRRPYKTLDGYVSVLVYTDRHWKTFFALAGRPEMCDDSRYATITGRTENIGELYRFVGETLARMTTAEALQKLDEADIAAAPTHALRDVFDDPHAKAVDLFPVVEHPTEGKIRPPRIASRWSASPPQTTREAPRLGQHSVELLSELGYARPEIDQFIAGGAVIDAAEASAP